MRGLILMLLLLAGGVAVSHADSESAGAAAEKAGKHREALNHYIAALQKGSGNDQELREKVIALAARIKPAPTVPEEAKRYLGRGLAAVELAKTAEDYQRAAAEFQKALRFAPWLADAYYNLGVVQEKAGRLQDAVRSYKLYLVAAPNAQDAEQVRTRLYGLEYKLEQQSNLAAQATRERQEFAALAMALEGAVFRGPGVDHDSWMEVRAKNGEIVYGMVTTDRDMVRFNPQLRDGPSSIFMPTSGGRARLSGYEIHPFTLWLCNTGDERPGTAILDREGRSLTIRLPCTTKWGEKGDKVLRRVQ